MMAEHPSSKPHSPPQSAPVTAEFLDTSEEKQSSSSSSTTSTPPWLRWSRDLHSLLDDPEGVELFETYLKQEGCSAQLDFLWACEGLKSTGLEDPPKIPQLIRSIHRHFIQNTTLLGINDDTRIELAQSIKDGKFSSTTIFDRAQKEVDIHMRDNLYPNFIKSEIYLGAATSDLQALSGTVEDTQKYADDGAESVSSTTSRGQVDPLTGEIINPSVKVDVGLPSPNSQQSPPSTSSNILLLPNQLQTVHEDKELSVNPPLTSHNAKFKLTKEALLVTQRTRAVAVPVPGVVTAGNGKVRKGEAAASHYNQPSIPFPYHASYSSYNPVSRVDSEIQSLSSDAMTDDGRAHHSGSSKKHGHHHYKHCQPPHHAEKYHLQPINVQNRDNLPSYPVHGGVLKGPNKEAEMDPKTFTSILIKKLEEVKKNMELKDKVQRSIQECDDGPIGTAAMAPQLLAAAIREKFQVQDEGLPDDILDKHVSRVWKDITPDARSPKLRSPTAGRRRGGIPHLSGGPQRQRRDRDVFSTFSGDSGNVHDYAPEPTSSSILFMPKSRSVPYELKINEQGDPSSQMQSVFQSQGGRLIKGRGVGHIDSRKVPLTMLTKKTSSEFLDSGISVLSGAAPSATAPPPLYSYDWVHKWVEECGDEKPRARSTTSPTASRRPRLPPTPTLEEVRRRLSKKPPHQMSQQPSTLPRRHHSPPSSEESFPAENSVSSFVFYEHSEVPYGFKIPCKSRSGGITLAVFKEYLPKRGNYRFFFKRECAELDARVVQEEVTDDYQVLPMYEGKIIAHLQAANTSSAAPLMM